MTMAIGGVLLAGAILVFVLHPLWAGIHAPLEKTDDEVSEVEALRRVKLLALRGTGSPCSPRRFSSPSRRRTSSLSPTLPGGNCHWSRYRSNFPTRGKASLL